MSEPFDLERQAKLLMAFFAVEGDKLKVREGISALVSFGRRCADAAKEDNPLIPPLAVLVALGSIAVHVDESCDPKEAHPFDTIAAYSALATPGLREWIKRMGPLLPLKRKQ